MLSKLKPLLRKLFKIWIGLCSIIGLYALLGFFPSLVFQSNDYVITEKTLEWPPGGRAESDYYIVATLSSGFGEVAAYPRLFYEKAQVGDHLHGKVNGYVKLVRDGHVVARHVGEDLIFVIVFAIAAFMPLLTLMDIKNNALRIVVRIFAVISGLCVLTVILAVIGAILDD